MVSIVAGSPSVNGYRDGDALNDALFNKAKGIAVDDNWNLYVVDAKNQAVRMISTKNGVVSTIAGIPKSKEKKEGAGKSATFLHPYGICVDNRNGDLFVTDDSTNHIRKICKTKDGEWFVSSIGISDPLEEDSKKHQYFGIAVAPNGDLFLTCDNALYYYNYKDVFGSKVVADGRKAFAVAAHIAYGIAVDTSGVYMVSNEGHTIKKFHAKMDWSPRTHFGFLKETRQVIKCLFTASLIHIDSNGYRTARRKNCPLARLPKEILTYVISFISTSNATTLSICAQHL